MMECYMLDHNVQQPLKLGAETVSEILDTNSIRTLLTV
jgi:hypothetical protein